MKNLLLLAAAIFFAVSAHAAQTTVNTSSDTFQTAWDRQQAMNTEIYSFINGNTIGEEVQAWDADLDTYSGITPSANVQTLLGSADFSAFVTSLGLVIGSDVQAWDADLDTYATITPSANVQSYLAAASYAAMRALLDLEIGTDVQAYNANTVIGPASATDDCLAIYDGTTGKSLKNGNVCQDGSNNYLFPGTITTTAADGSRKVTLQENTVAVSPTAASYEIYMEDSVIKKNVNGVEDTIAGLADITAAQAQSLAIADLNDPTTPSVLTTAETTSRIISNYQSTGADHVFQFPTAHIYGQVIFVIGDEFEVDFDPPSGTAFYLNGTEMAVDENIVNIADTLGQQMVCYTANLNGTLRWMCESKYSDFAEATP